MSKLIFVVFQLAFWGLSVHLQWSLIWPALITGIWLLGLIRSRNIGLTRDRKREQIYQCALALKVPDEYIGPYFESDEWLNRDSYNDVHPGRVADELAAVYQQAKADKSN